MKKKILAMLLAGVIAISAIPTVTAITEDGAISHDGILRVSPKPCKYGFRVEVCYSRVTNEMLAEWVADGSIPANTAFFSNCIVLYCPHCSPLEQSIELFTDEYFEYVANLPRHLTDLTPLSQLSELVNIHIDAPITDLSPLSGLTNLVTLGLRGTQITDLSPLAGLTNLDGLFIENSLISDLTPLSGLVNLRRLGLNGNQITDISPLAGLTNLWHLNLRYNPVTDISPLAGLNTHITRDEQPDCVSIGQMLGRLVGLGQATVQDALAILRYTVGLPSILDVCPDAYAAALIVSEDTPGVRDALQILRSLVGLSSVLD
jgi:Leucine-rich repeat (LRR) protein